MPRMTFGTTLETQYDFSHFLWKLDAAVMRAGDAEWACPSFFR